MNALFRWVSLRHFFHEAPRTLLTVLGIALGVAVFVSIRLASTSALASFSDTVDAVAGKANLQIVADTDGFDENAFPRVRSTAGVRAAAPVVELYAAARAGGPLPAGVTPAMDDRGGYDETVLVLGLDLFSEGPFVRYEEETTSPLDRSPLEFLADPRGVAITRTLARRHGLESGDTLTVLSAGRPQPLTVRRIIESEAFQQAFGGNVVVLDIGVAQEVFQRVGRLDRIDLIVDPGERDDLVRRLELVVPENARVDTPAGRSNQVENMVRAFELNLTALSFIALFVASFLIFNAVSMAVLRRRQEIAILRALGTTRGAVRTLFTVEGLVLGVLGSVIGLGLGTLFARVTLGAVSRTLSDLYLVRHAEQLTLDAPTYVIGLVLGIGIAFVSALAPAIEAAGTPPGVAMRQGTFIEGRRIPVGRLTLAGVAVLLLAAAVAVWTVWEHQPYGGFASAFLVVVGFAMIAPAVALGVETAAGPPLRKLLGIEAALGARYLREAVARTSVVIAALMVSVGMMVALSIMVGSFRRTVDVWIGQSVRGDLYVEPVGHRLDLSSSVMPPDLVAAARELPGVAAVDSYRGTRVPIGDRVAFVAGVDFAVQADYGNLQFMEGRGRDVLQRALSDGSVIVTESFHHHRRVSAGDTISLATPTGEKRLRVEGVFYDYTTDAGAILMDKGLFARLWDDPRTESIALYLEDGADIDEVRHAFLELVGGRIVLHVIPNQALRDRVLTVFDQTFQITWALQAIAILVSVLGVIGALTALILQRGREIGVLRATGALRSQIRTMVLVESGLLGLIGALLGSACGVALALLLVHVINRQFFGWTIRMTVEPGIFVQALLLMVVTALISGIVPARLAASRVAAEAMRIE